MPEEYGVFDETKVCKTIITKIDIDGMNKTITVDGDITYEPVDAEADNDDGGEP